MRIHTIEVQGLWLYREHVRVELDGLPLVVAVGQNGTGKSALFVGAVMAALYGRFPTRTAEESISRGQRSGTATVEFSVGGARYRVARTWQRSGTAAASLHTLRDGEWEAVTEKGVREVTAKVTELLGMPAETALMTWVAEQGQYGRFATATPSERFKLLSGVFGLDGYTPKYRAALAQQKALIERRDGLIGQVTELTDGLVDDDSLPHDGLAGLSDSDLATQAAAARAAVDAAAAALAAHRQHSPATALTRAQAALSAVKDARLARLAAATAAISATRDADTVTQARYRAALSGAETGYAGAVDALRTRISTESSAAQGRIEDAEEQMNTLEGTEKALPAAREAAVAAASKLEHTVEATEAARVRWAEQQRAVDEATLTRRTTGEQVAAAQAALEALGAEENCITCGQHLSADLIQTITAAQRADLARLQAQLGAADAVLAASDAPALHDAHLAAVEAQQTARERAAYLAMQLNASETAVAGIGRFRDALARDRARLTELGAEARTETERLAAQRDAALLAAEVARATESATAATALSAAIAEEFATRAPSEAEQALEAECAAAEAAAASDTEHAETDARLSAERDATGVTAAAFDAETGRRAEQQRQQARVQERITAAKTALAAAEQAVSVHTELANAYSPAGIPSMILESVVDDLNAAINGVLERLSGGELVVRLATTRETASGAQESKVTVYVSTPTGTGGYESLSGGQKLRADIAIRMGLATIIARGTGTPIETFILDEGWGMLDEAGIRQALEVLTRLSEEVTVLTVSHIDSVRDGIPARVEVTAAEGTSEAIVVS